MPLAVLHHEIDKSIAMDGFGVSGIQIKFQKTWLLTNAHDLETGFGSGLPGIRPSFDMMTSSNGNIFRVTGPLCGEFTGPGEFLTQRPVTRSFDVSFDLRLNKRLSKHTWGWWFETLSGPLWRQRNEQRIQVKSKSKPSSWKRRRFLLTSCLIWLAIVTAQHPVLVLNRWLNSQLTQRFYNPTETPVVMYNSKNASVNKHQLNNPRSPKDHESMAISRNPNLGQSLSED